MADISKIKLPSGTTYDIKDAVAREQMAGGVHFQGVTSTALADESTTTTYTIGQATKTAANGDLVVYNKKEFLYSTSDNKWHELGDNSAFKALAYKDTASASYTPAGTVSQPTFTGTQKSVSLSGTPAGTVAITTGSGTANYTPQGSISQPAVNVTLNTASKYVAGSATGGGSVTAGTAASCTLPTMSMTVANELLTVTWGAGSFTANTPTAVTMPTFTSQTIGTSVKSAALAAAPEFTGTPVELAAEFTGSSLTVTGNYTPEGTVSKPTFSGTAATITVS